MGESTTNQPHEVPHKFGNLLESNYIQRSILNEYITLIKGDKPNILKKRLVATQSKIAWKLCKRNNFFA